ncbi:MAG: bifunctional phosphoribosyl-AMP cyclohydrolase/phosphoribosyl-ATP diphosphatase HisIE [Cellulosilyticaceae bacterium]
MEREALLQAVKYDEAGLVPVIAQDLHSKKVRMLAYMNEKALRRTLQTGRVHYYSRSRQCMWLKGETSGAYQYMKDISIDCDGDTLLIQIEQVGGISCHTGHAVCFYRGLEENYRSEGVIDETVSTRGKDSFLEELYQVVLQRQVAPTITSYTSYLFEQGLDKILKKVGEEATEVVIAAKGDSQELLAGEVADLMYHLTVLLTQQGINWGWVADELKKRST